MSLPIHENSKQPQPSDFSDLIRDYHFDIPADLIAQEPSEKREDARLLLIRRNPEKGLPRFEDLLVSDLPKIVKENPQLGESLWVRNRSRVFPARFYAKRPTGGKHEIVLLETLNTERTLWKAIIRGSGDFKYPQKLFAIGNETFEFSSPSLGVLDFSQSGVALNDWLWEHGEMPLPPYIKNRKRHRDLERYQSVWSKIDEAKSAAAPTASLHFSEQLLEQLSHLHFCDLSLHVGLGTFEPVRCEKLSEHSLHWEHFAVPRDSLKTLLSDPSKTCIGTTALRCLESLSRSLLEEALHRPLPEDSPMLLANSESLECELDSTGCLRGKTKLFVRPGHSFQHTQHLWTNFHLPESTLFVLVSCFAGSLKLAKEAYEHAIRHKYRFFSYGDASLWI